tara:strand:- start:1292 stop:3019 length:1728 start_codon:yes stop_codon:yes gene_type:complete
MKFFISIQFIFIFSFGFSQSDSVIVNTWNQMAFLEDSMNYNLFIGGPSSVSFNLKFSKNKVNLFENGSFYQKEQIDLPFLKNNIPILDAQYIIGDELEQNLALFHSQPISNRSNYAVSFLKRSHDGYYLNQATNANFFQANYFYRSEQNTYELKTSLKHHRIYNEQNGGVTNDSSFTNSNFDILNRKLIDVNLENAYTNDKLWRLKIQQTLFKKDSLHKKTKLHSITSIDRRVRNYFDSLNADLFLYNYMDTIRSNDSIITHDINQSVKYYLLDKSDSISSKRASLFYHGNLSFFNNHTIDTLFQNHTVGFDISFNNKQSYLSASIDYTLFGFRNNNFNAVLNYNRFIKTNVKFSSEIFLKRLTPSYEIHQFTSNHVAWNNNPNDIYFGGLNSYFSFNKLKIKANIFLIKNPVYFDNSFSPVSTLDTVQIIQSGLNYKMANKKLEVDFELLYQYQGGLSIYQLPDWLGYARVYYKLNHEKSNSKLYLGLRGRFFSSFNLMEYSPQINQFLVSNERLQNPYGIIDVLAKAEIKNVTIYAMLSHVNAGLLGYEYFTNLHYPQPDRYFKFGLKWLFLN